MTRRIRRRPGAEHPGGEAVAVLALLLSGGCAESGGLAPPASSHDAQAADTPLDAATRAAVEDAARRTGSDVANWAVEKAEPVTWRDGALGCPQPGVLYTQALVPGYRIIVRSGGIRLDYHASLRGTPVLCPAGQAQEPLPADGVR